MHSRPDNCETDPRSDPGPVLLLAWSGADWKLLEPLLESDDLPNLAGLIASGLIGHLTPSTPVEPALSLTTAVTGVNGHEHRVLTAEQPAVTDSFMPVLEPVTSRSRATPALWNYLQSVGRSSAIINWPATYPAEAVDGLVVSDRFFHAGSLADLDHEVNAARDPASVSPAELIEDLAPLRVDPRSITREQMRLFVPSIDQLDVKDDPRLRALATVIARTATIQNVATATSDIQADLLVVRFDAPMLVCRHFMDYHPPKHPLASDEDAGHFAQVIPQTLRLLDKMLGVLLDAVGPDTDVVLFSDHGWHTTPGGKPQPAPSHPEPPDALCDKPPAQPPIEPGRPEQYQRADGLIVMAGPSISPRAQPIAASLIDLAPTVLALCGVRRPSVWRGGVLGSVRDTDPAITATEEASTAPTVFADPWRHALVVDDLMALDLLLAPSADLNTFRDLLHRRALAWGLQALAAGDWAVAADQLTIAVTRSDSFQTRLGLGRALMMGGKLVRARAHLDEMKRMAPLSPALDALLETLSAHEAKSAGGCT